MNFFWFFGDIPKTFFFFSDYALDYYSCFLFSCNLKYFLRRDVLDAYLHFSFVDLLSSLFMEGIRLTIITFESERGACFFDVLYDISTSFS